MKMTPKMIVGLTLAGTFLVTVGICVIICISTSNTEISLRNEATAQQKKNEVIYDKVWKVLQQKAGILEKYSSDFKNIYTNIMNERYEGEQAQAPMFKWITEHNPQFSVEMYKDLSDAIESNRAEFAMVQSRLLDIKREHDDIRMKWPGKIVVGKRPALDIVIVTSTKTGQTFSTGKEDDIDLFKKESK